MSLNSKKQIAEVAKIVCRELRKRSTEAEKILWKVLRNRQLLNKKFYRQYPLFYDVTGKETFFIADFYCYEVKIVIEIDGEYHKHRIKEDKERTEIINYLGIKLIRFKNKEIEENINTVLEKVKKELNNSSTGG